MKKELLFITVINQILLLLCNFKIKNRLLYSGFRKRVAIPLILIFTSFGSYAQLTTETFESNIPSTWTTYGDVPGTSLWGISTDGYQGGKAAYLNPSADNIGASNTAQYFMVTPSVPLPTNGEIRFFSKQATATDNGAIYQVRLSTADQSFSVVLKSWTEAELNTGSQTAYEEKILQIPSGIPVGLNVYIAFVVINTQTGATPSGDAWFVDNVRMIESCLKVAQADFNATSITANGANLAWTHPVAYDFQVQVVPQGTAPLASGISVNNSYPASGLSPDTFYDVYIKTICDATTSSGWAGPFPFKTKILGLSCISPIVIPNTVAPYIFSGNLNAFAANPTSYTTQGSNCLSSSVTGNFLAGSKAFFNYTPTQNGLLNIKQFTLPYSQGSGCFGNAITGVFVYENCASVGVNCLAGLNTTATNAPKYISNLYVEAGHTYTIVISSSSPASTSICFTFELKFSACSAPSIYTYKNLLQESVFFSWNNPANLANSWEYVVQPLGIGEPTGSGTVTNTNVDNIINTGLVAGTAYELYVRSVCNGTPGEWGMPYKFTTQCNAFATPYHTEFLGTSATIPQACWTSIDINNDGLTWGYAAGWDVPNYASIYTGTYQNNNNDILSSPQIIFDGPQKRLRFKHQVVSGVSKYAIKLSTTGVGGENFTTIIMPETPITNTAWQEKIINLPVGITGNVNIAWVVVPGTGSTAARISITDVYIEDKPACPDPVSPIAENVTTTSAKLSWTNGETETQWQVAIQPLGTGIPTGNGLLVNSNPYIAIDLNAATRYEYYVRAYCDATHQSNWIGPFNFTTLCTSFDTPYYESFDDADLTTKKFCWSINDANGDGAQWIMNGEYPSIQPSTSWFNPTTGFDDYLISPAINAVGVKILKFDYRAAFSMFAPTSRFGLEVLISTTDTNPASFTVLSPLMEFTNTDFLEKSIYFEGTGTVYIAFRVPPAYSVAGGSSILHLDNVSIEDAPVCPQPADLVASNILQNQASLSWAAGFQEQAWSIVVQQSGSGIPTVAGTTVTTANYLATTLEPNTVYEFYVRANCATENSQWTGPFTFRTLCTAFNTPFVETFNSDSTSEDCWRVINANNDGNLWNMQVTVNPYEGDQMAGMFTGSNGANNDWLISPTVNVTANQRLRFYYKVYNSAFTEDLEIKLSTNGIGIADFTTVLYDSAVETVLINNMEYKEMIINLPAGITGNINIGWHIPEKAPNPWGYRGQLLFIDNVIIENIPACSEISNTIVSQITDTQVQLAWDANGTETSWEISVQPYGTPAPTGATLPAYLHTTTTNPYTVTGLTPATKYEYYVRAICSTTLQSQWVGPFEYTTKCSFENLCEYTITLSGGPSMGIGGGINVIQNGYIVQTLDFPSGPWNEIVQPVDFTLFLCTGVEFSLFWDSIGTAPGQFTGATVTVTNSEGVIIATTDLGLLPAPRSTFFTGIATCGTITCPQPTNLAVSPTSQFSWTAGGTETQWEVFVQPVGNNTLPQSGTIVNSPTYTPTVSDFNLATGATFEYFVRAICGTDNTSFWSGPKVFVRNDDASTAIKLQVNENEVCNVSASDVTFNGATASADPMTCAGFNGGDIWFEFDALSKVHIIEANGFTGNFYISSGDEAYPDMTMTLYHVSESGDLVEKACSNNNSIVAMYTSELVVGDTYKVRLTLNTTIPNTRKFNVCVTTPLDLCKVNAVNYDFETPPMQSVTGVLTIGTEFVVPGWRVNLDTWDAIFFAEALNAINFAPYSGGQCIQLLSDPEESWDANDLNIKGTYKEFDTSEITVMDYSFAHATRVEGNSIQLYAGPPTGPFTLVREEPAVGLAWTLHAGEYNVPAGQNTTRFIFRTKENKIGNLLDAANFTANVNIKTAPQTLACQNTSVVLEAEGTGTWIADEANPAITLIANATTKIATISGFNTPGVYTYHWKTRYCDKTVTVTYEGFNDVPTVTTPVEYCLNTIAQPLTAIPSANYTLQWFTEEIGGTGTATAPIPATTAVGNTIYYVSNVNAEGCVGPRVALSVTINNTVTPEVGFAYDASQYCIIGTNPILTLNNDFATGGTFIATPAGLAIDATTGAIDLATSTPGSYDVTYSVLQNECVLGNNSMVTIVITPTTAPVVDFSYTTPVCTNNANLVPALANNFTAGGTFSSTTLTVNATTGEIDMTSVTAGTHDIVYEIASSVTNCQASGSSTSQVVINAFVTPVTGFAYNASYCQATTNPLPTLVPDFYVGGLFSSSTGLIINASTGEIDLENSPAGTHSVTYDIASSGCVASGTNTVSVTINALTIPAVSFTYAAVCVNATTNPLPVLGTGFTQGGTFSSSTVTVNSSTGAIDLASATEGVHEVSYILNENVAICTDGATFTAEIIITDGIIAVTSFTYDATYCAASANTVPVFENNFTSGGTFTSTTGLSINANTGEISIAQSIPGTYQIKYEVNSDLANCLLGGSSIYTITIVNEIAVSIDSQCIDQNLWLNALPVDNSFEPSAVTYTWKNDQGIIVGTNSSSFNVSEYVDQHQIETFPLNFTVSVGSGICSGEVSYTVGNISCKMIPKGISPNGDGMNDTFDLTGMGVRYITIFNRYGTEVYTFRGNYTNQWHGQTNDGNTLSDATYFYSITKQDGSAVTGWVYINKQY